MSEEVWHARTDGRVERLGKRKTRGELEESHARVLDEVDHHAARALDNALGFVQLQRGQRRRCLVLPGESVVRFPVSNHDLRVMYKKVDERTQAFRLVDVAIVC